MNDNNIRDRSAGDEYRELLTDLNWVRAADAVQLRVALHALSWRCHRSTVDAFASDLTVARKVLVVADGIRGELNARIDAADEEGGDNVTRLLRRLSAMETVITTCKSAVQIAEMVSEDSDHDLLRAIASHASAISPEDARDADRKLWQVLKEAPAAS